MPGFFDGNGGMRVAWVGACMGILGIFWEFLGGLLVRHVIPRGFAVPLFGLAQAQLCRWGMLACLMVTGVCGVRSPG